MTIGEVAARIAEIDVRRKLHKAATDALEAERGGLEEQLLDLLADAGLSSVRTAPQVVTAPDDGQSFNGGCSGCQAVAIAPTTVHARRDLWLAAPNGRDHAIAGLRRAGAGILVAEAYNSQSASAWMRELPRTAKPEDLPIFPAAAGDDLGVSEKYSIRTRRA